MAERLRLIERTRVFGFTTRRNEMDALFKEVKVEKPNDVVHATVVTTAFTTDTLAVTQFRKNPSTGELIQTTEEPLIIKGEKIETFKHLISSWLPKAGNPIERLLGKREISLESV